MGKGWNIGICGKAGKCGKDLKKANKNFEGGKVGESCLEDGSHDVLDVFDEGDRYVI